MLKKHIQGTAAFPLLAVFLIGMLTSCTGFFSHSWAEWAARDRSKMEIKVTADNIDDLMDKAENDRDLQLAILRNLAGAVNGTSGRDKQKLQNAGIELSISCTGMVSAMLRSIDNPSDLDGMGQSGLANYFSGSIRYMTNLQASTDYLLQILPPDMGSVLALASDGNAVDMALASLLLICAGAEKDPDPVGYIENFDGNDISGKYDTNKNRLAKELGDTSADIIDNNDSAPEFLKSILQNLKLN